MNIYEKRIIEYMEDTTLMNRGEVDPSLEGVILELKYQLHPLIIKTYMPFIERYYRYMVIKEWLEFQEWRQGKNG
jgi:hypothetical protein